MGALDDILSAVGWAGAACGVGLAFYWSVGLWRIAATRRTLPTARAGLALAAARTAPWPSVAIVIPAHNEARVIAELIASLRAIDYPRLRVTLALDRCTDGTPDLARTPVESVKATYPFYVLRLAGGLLYLSGMQNIKRGLLHVRLKITRKYI